MLQLVLDRKAIAQTYSVIRPYIRRTPVIEVDGADFGLEGVTLVLKLEFMQHAGSFKARGAFTNLLRREVPPAGVVAASGGNHGAAVAYAAMRLGKPPRIFVPTVASPAKLDRIRSYGADLVVTGDRYADALAASEEWAAQSGAMPIHAYEQVETLLGQGTVGLEFEEQDPKLDSVLVAVGGGGLIGGIAAWYAGRTKVVAVEPELCPTLEMAMAAGRPVDAPSGGIAADAGAQASRRTDVPHRASIRKPRSAGARRNDRRRTSRIVEGASRSRRARRRSSDGRRPIRPLPGKPWRTRGRPGLRSEHHGSFVRLMWRMRPVCETPPPQANFPTVPRELAADRLLNRRPVDHQQIRYNGINGACDYIENIVFAQVDDGHPYRQDVYRQHRRQSRRLLAHE